MAVHLTRIYTKTGDDGTTALGDMSDATLVVAVGRWRDDALAELYRRHAGAVYSLARRMLSEASDAEEAVLGRRRARLFRVGKEPQWFAAGERLPLNMGAP